ncbi:Dyp-type peroxidase [Solilutibacter silvestris]|uniref:Dyp-type peroxidase protein n=1 Tax=Solilutibacter silvestris TaxID=1645665 RepID=A0A2K1PZ73_9GAMM|nr:Dyp-type peroxidase [Lysobacter silvestris]PNS08080.1 Dyp-type peroxidase protein [Lysobacter silvestris]
MVSAVPQAVAARLTRSAIFLVVTIKPGNEALDRVRNVCGNLSGLVRSIGFRNLDGEVSCVMGIGSQAWDRLFASPRPKELHPFQEIRGVHVAPSTPGDLLFHIRSRDMGMCFSLANNIVNQLADAVDVVDEVHGFKFFDDRDLLGFVDGTENPTGPYADEATLIGAEDPAFTGGSYVIVQKYLHKLDAWNAQTVEVQENVIGRRKVSDIELDDAVKKPFAHNVLTTIEENGVQLKIVRDNMPFGEIGKGEFGTYFIGYSCSPARTEQMLTNMFVGKPPGNYDRLLDFSTAVTGALFFVPTADFLDNVPSTDLPPTSDAVVPGTGQ